jgi:hypothetical protein
MREIMALADPITFAYDAGTVSLNRVNQDSFGAVYYGTGTNLTITLTVKHNVPGIGKDGESHLCRVDIDHFDATTNAFKRRCSAWCAVRTDGTPQDSENTEDVTESLVDFLSDGNITKLVSRQS